MAEPAITRRVEILEQQVSVLSTLPGQVAALRDDMNAGFVALREEIRGVDGALCAEIRGLDGALRAEIRTVDAGLRAEISALREEGRAGDAGLRAEIGALRDEMRTEIRAGDEETRRYMRVLYEDLVERIKTLGESRNARPRKPPRS